MACFRAWEDWQVYPLEKLIQLQNTFLGLVVTVSSHFPLNMSCCTRPSSIDIVLLQHDMADVDGEPVADAFDLDGIPLDVGSNSKLVSSSTSLTDIDGKPLRDTEPATSAFDGDPSTCTCTALVDTCLSI